MSHDIWVTNRDSVIHWIERMSDELQRLRSLLQDAQDEELLEIFAGARIDRDAFLASPPVRKAPETSDASMGTRDLMMDMLVGGMMGDKLRKMRDLTEEPPEAGKKAAPATAKAPDEAEEEPARLSLGDRIAEDVRRDLEKMEKKRAEKEAQKQQAPPDS
jgi:hypothetical protein